MKIAICAENNTLDSEVSRFFARCNFFLIYDDQSLKSRFIKNEIRLESSNAGNMISQFLTDLNVEVVLVPLINRNAFESLRKAGIKAYKYQTTTVHTALYDYYANNYLLIEKPSTRITE